jgi:hypothetical protein
MIPQILAAVEAVHNQLRGREPTFQDKHFRPLESLHITLAYAHLTVGDLWVILRLPTRRDSYKGKMNSV